MNKIHEQAIETAEALAEQGWDFSEPYNLVSVDEQALAERLGRRLEPEDRLRLETLIRWELDLIRDGTRSQPPAQTPAAAGH